MKVAHRGQLGIRKKIIETCKKMNQTGINRGSSGNVSQRVRGGLLITPSGLPYTKMSPGDIVFIDESGTCIGEYLPSSEWRFHFDIYQKREDINSIVHAHSTFASAISCLRIDIPAFHYMVARAGGEIIKCSNYATFGTKKLSGEALKAIENRWACLLANHGQISCGKNLNEAIDLAAEVEELAHQFWASSLIGTPKLLSSPQMRVVLRKFKTYGKTLKSNPKGEINE